MTQTRQVNLILESKPVIEGAGVHLKRVFGVQDIPQFDPFLMLDDFRSDKPEDYLKGFPWHPHRGIETITYILEGEVKHGDSLGNNGIISAGDVQWMTAGSGIIHQEMPRGDAHERMGGFQLWANLPAVSKMIPPRYQDIKKEQIPEINTAEGATIRIICGQVGDVAGPVTDIMIEPEYLDISLPADAEYRHPTKPGHTVFAYLIDGQGMFENGKDSITNGQVVLFGDGEEIAIFTKSFGARFLLIAGKPLGEPVAWRGPIVMNTEEELQLAFEEYRNGAFIKE